MAIFFGIKQSVGVTEKVAPTLYNSLGDFFVTP
jgi:hypothetical protein